MREKTNPKIKMVNVNDKVIPFKVYTNDGKPKEDNELINQYLRDYFQLREFLNENDIGLDDRVIISILESTDSLIKTRILMHYEYKTAKESEISYKDVLKSNREYIEKIRILLEEYKNREHLSFLDEMRITELESQVLTNNTNVISGLIYRSSIRDSFDKVSSINNTRLFNILTGVDIPLGTMKESKGKLIDVNYNVASIYYSILCNNDLKKEYIDVLEKRKNISMCDERIQYLYKKIGHEAFVNFRKCIEERSLIIEMLLLIFLINKKLYDYDIEELESYYSEDELTTLMYSAEDTAIENIDKMYLSMNLRIKDSTKIDD